MSPPYAERVNPRDAALAATARGRFHDVVVGASKVVHSQALNDRDRVALQWASEMLADAQSKEVLLAMPSAQQLSGVGNIALAIRRATGPDEADASDSIQLLREGIAMSVQGKRSNDVVEAMEALRSLFSLISRVSLHTEVVSQGDPGSENPWSRLTMSLNS